MTATLPANDEPARVTGPLLHDTRRQRKTSRSRCTRGGSRILGGVRRERGDRAQLLDREAAPRATDRLRCRAPPRTPRGEPLAPSVSFSPASRRRRATSKRTLRWMAAATRGAFGGGRRARSRENSRTVAPAGAETVAERGSASTNAISPTTSPGPRRATSSSRTGIRRAPSRRDDRRGRSSANRRGRLP